MFILPNFITKKSIQFLWILLLFDYLPSLTVSFTAFPTFFPVFIVSFPMLAPVFIASFPTFKVPCTVSLATLPTPFTTSFPTFSIGSVNFFNAF